MTTCWFTSDSHFGHSNILGFSNFDGTPVRIFKDCEEMDEFMVTKWNSVVGKNDRIYHLGDVAIARKNLSILGRLNGKKVLIKGNHDIFKLKDYTPWFEDIRSYKVFTTHKFICSHIPIHPDCIERFKANVHGHLHCNTIKDPRYVNISVEKTNYTPVSLEWILTQIPH